MNRCIYLTSSSEEETVSFYKNCVVTNEVVASTYSELDGLTRDGLELVLRLDEHEADDFLTIHRNRKRDCGSYKLARRIIVSICPEDTENETAIPADIVRRLMEKYDDMVRDRILMQLD